MEDIKGESYHIFILFFRSGYKKQNIFGSKKTFALNKEVLVVFTSKVVT